jgi:hypothetical protein
MIGDFTVNPNPDDRYPRIPSASKHVVYNAFMIQTQTSPLVLRHSPQQHGPITSATYRMMRRCYGAPVSETTPASSPLETTRITLWPRMDVTMKSRNSWLPLATRLDCCEVGVFEPLSCSSEVRQPCTTSGEPSQNDAAMSCMATVSYVPRLMLLTT